jgi:preprotein translocase subunit SecF
MEEKKKFISRFKEAYDRHYKLLLVLTAFLIFLSLAFLFLFYVNHHDFIYRDISLSGGTSITIYNSTLNINQLKQDLPKLLGSDVDINSIKDVFSQEQKAVIIQTSQNADTAKQILETYLGYSLTDQNSTFEFTSSSLSSGFYQQLLVAVLIAFSFMGVVVFFLFGKGKWIKTILILLAILSPFLFFALEAISINFALILSLITLILSLIIYWKFNVPSFAVVLSAFADILMTLVVIDMMGMKISSAGIIAFLMLIGYSVDTDILLTNRVLKGIAGSTNHRIWGAFKTGITMTFTAILAVLAALIMMSSFSSTMAQIFTILAIGLCFDIYNTWVTNACIIKWYATRKNETKA